MRFLNLQKNKRLLILTLTYGCYLTCTSIVTWGGYNYFLEGNTASNLFLYEHFARNFAFPLALLTAGVVAFFNPKKIIWRSPAIAMILFVLGGLLAIIQQYAADPNQISSSAVFVTGQSQNAISFQSSIAGASAFFAPFSLIIAGLLFGLGGGIICCSLQETLSSLKVYEAGYVVFGGTGFSVFVYFMLDIVPDTTAKQLFYFFVLIPFMAALVQFIFERESRIQKHPMFDSAPYLKPERCFEAFAELWKPLVCMVVNGFILGIVRVLTTVKSNLYLVSNNTYMVTLFISSLFLLLAWSVIYERVRLSRLHQLLFPITATSILVLPLVGTIFQDFAMSVTFLVYSIMSSLMVVSCIRTARNQSLNPVLIYGLFCGIVHFACLLGSVIGVMADISIKDSQVTLLIVAMLSLYFLSMIINTDVKSLEIASEKLEKWLSVTEERPSLNTTFAAVQAEEDFRARCLAVCQQYKLSRREGDVLALLARGRDVPYISEELVISKNTVRTHSKSIFSKTSVHSRQELIDLVECTEI